MNRIDSALNLIDSPGHAESGKTGTLNLVFLAELSTLNLVETPYLKKPIYKTLSNVRACARIRAHTRTTPTQPTKTALQTDPSALHAENEDRRAVNGKHAEPNQTLPTPPR